MKDAAGHPLRHLVTPTVVLALLLSLAAGADAESTTPVVDADTPWNALSGPLLQFLAVAIVIESAFSALFNWRVFRIAFNARALKTPIMFAVGMLLVLAGYDPMGQILEAGTNLTELADRADVRVLTASLSALMLAGGSEGVFQLLKRLGIRVPAASEIDSIARELRSDQAWISIRVAESATDAPVQIGIEQLDAADTDPRFYIHDHAIGAPLAGSIDSRSIGQRIRAAFTSDGQRFPAYGGYKVAAGSHYRITASWKGGHEVHQIGAFRGRFAPRAIIDMTIELSDANAWPRQNDSRRDR